MTSLRARYGRGEHEQVWTELRELGPVPERLRDDIAAVATETMRRVAGHIARIVATLPSMGFVGEGATPVRVPAGDEDRAFLPELAAQIGGLPAALEACLAEVGWVSLLGDCPALGLTYHEPGPIGSMPPGPAFPDPLCLPSVQLLRTEWDELGSTRPPGVPFGFAVAPDELHKADISGGVHEVHLPDTVADPVLRGVAGRPDVTLVEYLRLSLRWGGFPGWSFAPAHAPAALDELTIEVDF